MRAVVVLFLAALVCVYAADTEIFSKWAQFQAKYGKSYRSPIEARKRLGIFMSNLEKIDAHNKLYEQGKVSYSYGVNKFADWTQEEFMAYVNKGKLNKPEAVPVRKTQKISHDNLELPELVDWRQKGAVTGVKDQGDCNSGWAFSTTGALEGALKLKNGTLISLSEQNLIDCSQAYGNKGCYAGFMPFGHFYIMDNGIASEESYPYQAKDGQCEHHEIVTKIREVGFVDAGDETDLQRSVASYGPIAASFSASSVLQHYKGGILHDDICYNDHPGINHGVLVVGYDMSSDEKYYIIKNSWGEDWGEGGYFRLPLNHDNQCAIASLSSYPIL